MQTPKLIVNELIEEVTSIISRKKTLGDFEKALLKRKIDQLKKADNSLGLMLYGLYYSAIGDRVNSIKSHEQSLNASGRSFTHLFNYAGSMKSLNEYTKAFNLYSESLKKSPNDISPIILMSDISALTLRLTEFKESLDLYIRASGKQEIIKNKEVESVLIIDDILTSLHVSESQAQLIAEKPASILKSHSIDYGHSNFSLCDSDEHKYLSIEIGVPCSAETLTLLNDELVSSIAEDFDITCWSSIVYRFTHFQK